MTPPDPTRYRFAGYVITASREQHRRDRRVPRFLTAHRFLVEECVHSQELQEPGHWDDFRLERPLKEQIPRKVRDRALQAVSDLAADSTLYARPNVCMTRDAVRAVLAAARVPRSMLQILEVGMREEDATEVLTRENFLPVRPGERYRPHGMVVALGQNRRMSGDGHVVGIEPWYLDKRLRQSWREAHDNRAVRARAFAGLNEYGLLNDMIDFELFLPGLTPRMVHNREAKWIPLLLVEHSVESIIGDMRRRSVPSPR